MANSVWQGTVQDASGNIVTGAEISVYDEGTGTLATIYSDIGGTALTNPFFSDSNGFAQFYATAGQYRITAVEAGSGLNQTFRHVRLGEAGSVDTGTSSDEVPKNSDLGTASTRDTGTGVGQVPLGSDLLDVLRDSDIGQTVAGLTSPGATNWDDGNLEPKDVEGIGTIMYCFAATGTVASGATVSSTAIRRGVFNTSGALVSDASAPGGSQWRNVDVYSAAVDSPRRFARVS